MRGLIDEGLDQRTQFSLHLECHRRTVPQANRGNCQKLVAPSSALTGTQKLASFDEVMGRKEVSRPAIFYILVYSSPSLHHHTEVVGKTLRHHLLPAAQYLWQ